jgi:hypothetical protein
VRSAIPAELFERSMFWSFFHLGVDLVKVAVMAAAMWALDASALPLAAKALAWPALWYLQGAFMTGIWVLAHECGHQAFSASKAVNDAVGLVLVSSQRGQTRGCTARARARVAAAAAAAARCWRTQQQQRARVAGVAPCDQCVRRQGVRVTGERGVGCAAAAPEWWPRRRTRHTREGTTTFAMCLMRTHGSSGPGAQRFAAPERGCSCGRATGPCCLAG